MNIDGTASEDWELISSAEFNGIVRLTSGYPKGIGFVGSSPPSLSTVGFTINREGAELFIDTGDSFYLRAYSGTVGVTLVPSGGASENPSFTTLTPGQIPQADNSGQLLYSGLTVDQVSGEITADKSLNVPAGTINIGEVLGLSEGVADLVIVDRLKKAMSFSVSSGFEDSTGSAVPGYFDFGSGSEIVNQPLDTTVITANPSTGQIVSGVSAPNVRLTDRVMLRANGPMTNVRISIVDNATGLALRYIPNKSAFLSGVGGLDMIAGENTFFLASDEDDTPGNFHLGFTPFLTEPGQVLNFTIAADAVDLLGEPGGVPYLAVEAHDGPRVELLIKQQQIIYVSKAGNDLNAGDDLNNPKITIGDAITAAEALNPLISNQIVIEISDAATYQENFTVPSFVHLFGQRASVDGQIDVEDSCVIKLRSALNSTNSGRVFRKDSGAGGSSIALQLLSVSGSNQEGLICSAGRVIISVGQAIINEGFGVKAKNGSEVAFVVGELILTNGARGLGTQVAGGAPNLFVGSVLRASDDGTCTLIKTKVDGDIVEIQGGSFDVDELYDLAPNSVLNAHFNTALGARNADPTATVNVLNTSGDTSLPGFVESRSGLIGSHFKKLVTVTATAFTATDESCILCRTDTAGEDIILTLPSVSARHLPTGVTQPLAIRNNAESGSDYIIVTPIGGALIDGFTTKKIGRGSGTVIGSDGANWFTIESEKSTARIDTVMSVDLVFDDTEQQIVFDSAQSSGRGLTVNPSGTLTANENGLYNGTLNLHLDTSGGSGLDLHIWFEVKPLSTGVWTIGADGRMSNPVYYDDGAQNSAFTANAPLLAGDELRLMIRSSSGNGKLETITTTVALGTLTSYAADLSIFKAGAIA